MRPSRLVFVKRVAPAVVAMAVAQEQVGHAAEWPLRQWIFERGMEAGCAVFLSGNYLVGARGPFLDDDLKHDAWNFAWRNAGWLVSLSAGFAAGAGVYAVCAWALGRTRVFGYRGKTVCGGCGHSLAGLGGGRCPECGRDV